MYKLED